MKRILLALAATAVVAAPVLADEALAKASKCTTCHAVSKAKVGPSFKDIANKGIDPAKMATTIMKGNGGAMPPSPKVSEADAKKLADWIASMK